MDIRSTHPINLLANGRYKVPAAMDREKKAQKYNKRTTPRPADGK